EREGRRRRGRGVHGREVVRDEALRILGALLDAAHVRLDVVLPGFGRERLGVRGGRTVARRRVGGVGRVAGVARGAEEQLGEEEDGMHGRRARVWWRGAGRRSSGRPWREGRETAGLPDGVPAGYDAARTKRKRAERTPLRP